MVWNKTPEEKVKQILNEARYTDKINEDIAGDFNCSPWLVGELCRKFLSKEERKERFSRLARKSKIGTSNPMYGRCGFSHPRHTKEITRSMGYKTVFPPSWWTGKKPKGRVYEHIYVYAEANGLTEIPKNHVVHHIDGDIDNNVPENLQLLTISEHIKLHWRLRKEQRLEGNLVGNSVPEAPNNQIG